MQNFFRRQHIDNDPFFTATPFSMSTDSIFERMRQQILSSISPELASVMNNNGATPPRRRNNSGMANTMNRRGPPFVQNLDEPIHNEDDEVQEAIRRSLMENQRISPRNNQRNLRVSDFEDLMQPEPDLEFPISDADLPYEHFEEPLQDPMELERKEQEEIERAIQASAEEEERRERQRLRDEQDRAYQESLRADAERVRRAKEEEMKKIEQEQRRQEELDREQLEEAMRLSVQFTQEQREKEELRRKSEQFRFEPTWQSNSDAVTQLGIRLPNGQRLTRNFLKSDKLMKVKEFIETRKVEDEALKEVIPAQFDLVQDFPRKVYDNLNLTLEQVGLLKRALISVQERY